MLRRERSDYSQPLALEQGKDLPGNKTRFELNTKESAKIQALYIDSYLYGALSVSSGETHSKPPVFIRVKIKTGLEDICTWLATWQAVNAWSPVIMT